MNSVRLLEHQHSFSLTEIYQLFLEDIKRYYKILESYRDKNVREER